jgi:hypothetical protein
MATIQLEPDSERPSILRMKWVERGEIIGRIVPVESGRCRIAPEGPHWSPMKSFAGFTFETSEAALAEVELYFRGR